MAKYIVGPDLTSPLDGYDGYFNTIDAAINGALAGDTIYVLEDGYTELATVDKAVDITSTAKHGAVLSTTGSYPLLLKNDAESVIDGMVILNKPDKSNIYAVYAYPGSAQKTIQNARIGAHASSAVINLRENTHTTFLNNIITAINSRLATISGAAKFSGGTITAQGWADAPILVMDGATSVIFQGGVINRKDGNEEVISAPNRATPLPELTIEGLTINYTAAGGHVISAGDESSGANDGNIHNINISNNTMYGPLYFDPSTVDTVSVHPLFVGHNINPTITRNHVDGMGYGMVYKGTNQGDTAGTIRWNKYVNCVVGVRIKGITGVQLSHHTIIQTLPGKMGAAVYISDNDGAGAGGVTQIENFIIKNLDAKKLIHIGTGGTLTGCDNNVYMSNLAPVGAPFYSGAADKSWADWVALGHDVNSIYIHINGANYDVYDSACTKQMTLDYCPISDDGIPVNRVDNPILAMRHNVTGVDYGTETDIRVRLRYGDAIPGCYQAVDMPSSGPGWMPGAAGAIWAV